MEITLSTIQEPIADSLKEFEEFVNASFSEEKNSLLADMVNYVISTQGKRLRPTVVMLAAGATCSFKFGKRTLLAAMLIEMIHAASLVHDDVIDESNMRRGKESVNARWQSRNAVIVGDYILAKNMSIGLQSGQYDLLSHIIGNMTQLCSGEILQADHASKLDTTRESYYDIIHKKTASLFSTCASAGAMSVRADRSYIKALQEYGENIGMVFQIVDDILDYTSTNAIGKPAGNDLKERKITLPLILVLEQLEPQQKQNVIKDIELCASSNDSIEAVRAVVAKYSGVERARSIAQAFLQRAMSSLSILPDTKYRQALLDLCIYIANRNK